MGFPPNDQRLFRSNIFQHIGVIQLKMLCMSDAKVNAKSWKNCHHLLAFRFLQNGQKRYVRCLFGHSLIIFTPTWLVPRPKRKLHSVAIDVAAFLFYFNWILKYVHARRILFFSHLFPFFAIYLFFRLFSPISFSGTKNAINSSTFWIVPMTLLSRQLFVAVSAINSERFKNKSNALRVAFRPSLPSDNC